jgi:hypothetical protein
MAKAPAFQFYVKDWIADLAEHPLEIEGAWCRFCAKAWLSDTPGELFYSLDQWARLWRSGPDDALRIIRYIVEEKIGDSSSDLTEISRGYNGKIHLSCRRMVREEKEKEDARIRQRRSYEKKKSDADITVVSRDSHGGSHENLTSPSSSASATAKTEEESSLRSDSCPEVAEPPAGQPPAELPKLVGTLPLADGSDFEVRQDLVDELAPLYPAVDVVQALRSMKGWLVADPKRRKTSRGVRRFICGWLDRDQNRGGNMQTARASPPRDPTMPRNYRECQDLERRQETARLKAAMGEQNAGFSDCPGGTGAIQHRPLPAKSLDA